MTPDVTQHRTLYGYLENALNLCAITRKTLNLHKNIYELQPDARILVLLKDVSQICRFPFITKVRCHRSSRGGSTTALGTTNYWRNQGDAIAFVTGQLKCIKCVGYVARFHNYAYEI